MKNVQSERKLKKGVHISKDKVKSSICRIYKCKNNECQDRIPRACNWFRGDTGCIRGKSCEFSHDTLVCDNTLTGDTQIFKCSGCKHQWSKTKCVVKHIINGTELYFCLNYDKWIQHKEKVFDKGWSFFDQDGNLSHLV